MNLPFGIKLTWDKSPAIEAAVPTIPVDLLNAFDGEKFDGGIGSALDATFIDYWTLRERSNELFTENLYAKGIIRRLLTNEIGPGLLPEATPDERVLGLADDSLLDWSETVESHFFVWAKDPLSCDLRRMDTLGAIGRTARLMALVSGDVLVLIHPDPQTGLPAVELLPAELVQSPVLGQYQPRAGNTIVDGVECDSRGQQVAYWIRQKDLSFRRQRAFGSKTGRRICKLVYGTERRHNEVRGLPILAIVLQSLKELDRYRDAAQRKAAVNSILAMFIENESGGVGSRPVGSGAQRKDTVTSTEADGRQRRNIMAQHVPGLVMDELAKGEKPHAFQSNVDVDFGKFEETIINAFAWALEVPPEVCRLSFQNNYSASQAAINEFKAYLNRIWVGWGEEFYAPIYEDWLLSNVLLGRIEAPGMTEAFLDPKRRHQFTAWMLADWYGAVKPSTDMVKQARASEMLVQNGWSTNAREARVLTGTKFSKNAQRLRRENERVVRFREPVVEQERDPVKENAE